MLLSFNIPYFSVNYTTLSVKPERNAAVHSPLFHSSVTTNLNSSVCSSFVAFLERLPVLHRLQGNAQLNMFYTAEIEVPECKFTVVQSMTYAVHLRSSYVLYFVICSSRVQLHCCTIWNVHNTFADRLRTVLHKFQFGTAVTQLYDLRFI